MTSTSPKTIVTKSKQKDSLHQLLLPLQTPHVYLWLRMCCLYICQWLYPFVSPVFLLLWEILQICWCQQVNHFEGKPRKHQAGRQKLLQTSDNMNSNVFFLCFFLSLLWWKKKRQMVITGYYTLAGRTFIASGDSWLLILRHMQVHSSVYQFKSIYGGFAIHLPDPSPPPSFQYFEPPFLYNS